MYMKTGLVLEGGAMRGMFTCGVLDVMMENGISFPVCAGISAGAVFGINFKSHQPGRAVRYNMKYARDPRYSSFLSLILTGDYYGKDFCYYEVPGKLDVFDTETFMSDPTDFWVGATDVKTGKAIFHKCTDGGKNDIEWLRASASLPLFSKIVEIGDRKLLDGGVANPIPYKMMDRLGIEKNVVVLTQPKGYYKEKSRSSALVRVLYRDYPELIKAVDRRHIEYNREVKIVEKREKEGRYFIIRPPEKLNVKRIEHDPDELEKAYFTGRIECKKRLSDLKRFLYE